MEAIIDWMQSILWSPPIIFALLTIGLVLSIATKFLQVRHVKEMVKLVFQGKSSEAGVSSFQAFSMALSGRLGTGNIAGVATAIAYGGPGAVFWMWAIAFIGSTTAFVESTLAQIYKEKRDGQYRGGPAFYIEKGIGSRKFASMFSIFTIIAMAVLMPGVQSNSISKGVETAFEVPMYITGSAIVLLLAFIIFGGTKRIAKIAEISTAFTAVGYILFTMVILLFNISELPNILALIIRSAFGGDAALGGMLGAAISWGVKRGIYSNEAGQGSGAHPAAAAEVSHPAKQGLVQAFSVYIDTLFVCSATAFMILATGAYNVVDSNGNYVVENLPGVEAGPAYTQAAVDSAIPGFGASFVAIALFLFAFTTIMAYYYIAETNLAYLLSGRNSKVGMLLLKLVILAASFYGSVRTATAAWTLGDVGLGLMVWSNIIAIVLLAKPALITLKDYEQQKKQGLEPVFKPQNLGIKNADYWEKEYLHNTDESEQVS